MTCKGATVKFVGFEGGFIQKSCKIRDRICIFAGNMPALSNPVRVRISVWFALFSCGVTVSRQILALKIEVRALAGKRFF
jgi:hypothetical protein